MNFPEPDISVQVDITNPGQFLACCGLLELAHRIWPGAEAWFHPELSTFEIAAFGDVPVKLEHLVDHLRSCPIDERGKGVIQIGQPFGLALDWWEGTDDELKPLKTWAGNQRPVEIARAAQNSIPESGDASLLNHSDVMRKQDGKKVEPFYFDARRFAPALDVGFSLDEQDAEVVAHPLVELLCFTGLQRYRPRPSSLRWHFDYQTWHIPIEASVAAAVASCALSAPGLMRYRFSTRFRDNRKRYKAFGFAARIGDSP